MEFITYCDSNFSLAVNSSMRITGTISRKAKSGAKRFISLRGFHVDFRPLLGAEVDFSLPPEDEWTRTDLQAAYGPGNFASLFGWLTTGVSVPYIYRERIPWH